MGSVCTAAYTSKYEHHPDASSGMAVLAVHALPDYALRVSHEFGPMLNCMSAEELRKSSNANWAASL